jgi:hypothetical protein
LYDPPTTATSARPKKASTPLPAEEEDVWVIPRNLFEAFERDAKTADKEYNNKALRIEGTVQTTGVDEGHPYVDIYVPSPGRQPAPIRCLFEAGAQAEVTNVKGGGNITIRGRCLGIIGDHISLDNCTIVRYRAPKY